MTSMRSRSDLVSEEFESLQFCFGFMHEHGVKFPKEVSIFYQSSTGKVGFLVLIFEGGFDCHYQISLMRLCMSLVSLRRTSLLMLLIRLLGSSWLV